LREDEVVAVAAHREERIAGVEDPVVHDRGDRLAGGLTERRPQIAGVGVAVGVRAEILPDAVAEDGGPEMLLHHPEDGRALLVGQDVEHRVGVTGRVHRILDRPRAP
jgi:hypothetical protein